MGHPQVEELSRWVDEMLGNRSTDVEEHLFGCDACSQWVKAFQGLKAELKALPVIEGVFQEPPLLIPRIRVGVPRWSVLLASLIGLSAGLLLRPATPAMKVISPQQPLISGSEGLIGDQVKPDTAVQTMGTGEVDLEIPGEIFLRLKPGTTLTWEQMDRGFWRKPGIAVNLMRGELLARTAERFWGSRMEVRTPTAMAMVKGTAFSMEVDPKADATTVKVLTGSIFFSPHLKKVGVHVGAGQQSRIAGQRLPEKVQELSPQERERLLETYRIGRVPLAAVVMGIGPGRVEELLQHGVLYLSDRKDQRIHPFLRRNVETLNLWILRGAEPLSGGEPPQDALRVIETALEYLRDEELVVPFRLFAGSCWVRLGNPHRGFIHFERMAKEFPRDPMASVALAAMAEVAQTLGDEVQARQNLEKILSHYPKSPEAIRAREIRTVNPRLTSTRER